ncbi:hypothetical protein B9T12_04620 [Wohlfahrtiimonas chitiniclastica]|uniref:RhuM family protein n=1 Tax=Wohlfahrtiimonas chitiniclastica TaxID=400946 RepID=UPI000B984F81|nr:RhuM family protein [Wohlfahrtiimonas chitiniclastica]OYQ79062.1 hypothetical protein B9T12_04620 [Wohlfahrtiimonas chitiniclastica]
MKKNTMVLYNSDDADIQLVFEDSSHQIWATAQNIADIYNADISNINKYIQDACKDLVGTENRTMVKFTIVQNEGGRMVSREVMHYNKDVVIAVGFRVSNQKASAFMQWATKTLGTYLEQGYVINKHRAEQDPEILKKLAAEVRALRSSEKATYSILRECFKICASDYNEASNEARSFFSLLQDKFYHAIFNMTAANIILDRADAREPNMGLKHFNGDIPTKEEACTAKNYFGSIKLFELNLLSESFLVLAESLVARGIKMTMNDLHRKIDEMLKLHEYSVFGGYENYLKNEANCKARSEHDKYIDILKLQMLDLDNPFNFDDFYDGEYEYLREEINQITLPQVKKSLPKIQEKLLLLNNNQY